MTVNQAVCITVPCCQTGQSHTYQEWFKLAEKAVIQHSLHRGQHTMVANTIDSSHNSHIYVISDFHEAIQFFDAHQ